MGNIRIFEFPKCKMVSSGYSKMDERAFEEGGKLNRFGRWWSEYDKKRTDRYFKEVSSNLHEGFNRWNE